MIKFNAPACRFRTPYRFRITTKPIILRILAEMGTHRIEVDIIRAIQWYMEVYAPITFTLRN